MSLKALLAFSLTVLCGGVSVMLMAQAGSAQALTGGALVAALQKGGYVIVMRHASSPREAPSKQAANADNVKLERQLDEAGRAGSTAMGKALRDLKIVIGQVLSSPTYRALETVKFAQLPNPESHAELGDRGQSMQGVSEADGKWLRDRAAQAPKSGNTLIVTHMPNVSRAFPQITGLSDGESLAFRPDPKGGATLVGRIKIEEWPNLRP